MTIRNPDFVTTLFRIGMWWRIGYGILKLFLGFTLLKLVGQPFADIFYALTQHELMEDKHDVLVQIIKPLIIHIPLSVTYFLAFYFIFWALIDIFLSIALLKEKLWAFPTGMVLILIFVIYELYRFTHTHSFILLGLIVVDLFLLYIIHLEYRKRLAELA